MNRVPQATRRWDNQYELRFPYNRDLVEALKAHIPSSHRSYNPDTKVWTVDTAYGLHAVDLLMAFFPDAKLVDNTDGAAPRGTYTPTPPHEVLYVLPNAPKCVVDAAYRALSREFHPDRAAESKLDRAHELQIALNEAYEALRDRVAS